MYKYTFLSFGEDMETYGTLIH